MDCVFNILNILFRVRGSETDSVYGVGFRVYLNRLRFRAQGFQTACVSTYCLPIGPIVVPFWCSYLESHKVIPKRNYYGPYGKGLGPSQTSDPKP